MANWCVNRVEITSVENWDAYKKFETWISNKDRYLSNKGEMPPDIKINDGYLFAIEFDEDNPEYFIFESKWVPPIKTMVSIGRTYGFSFTLEFEELAMGLYGEYVWDNSSEKLYVRHLTHKELIDAIDEDDSPIYEEYDRLLYKKDLELKETP